MILIVGELRMKDHWDVLLSEILECFQSLTLTMQEITVQDRALTDFLPQNKMKIRWSKQRFISMLWIRMERVR